MADSHSVPTADSAEAPDPRNRPTRNPPVTAVTACPSTPLRPAGAA